jgi:hypothetical protein
LGKGPNISWAAWAPRIRELHATGLRPDDMAEALEKEGLYVHATALETYIYHKLKLNYSAFPKRKRHLFRPRPKYHMKATAAREGNTVEPGRRGKALEALRFTAIHPTLTGRVLGDPPPGRTPWA